MSTGGDLHLENDVSSTTLWREMARPSEAESRGQGLMVTVRKGLRRNAVPSAKRIPIGVGMRRTQTGRVGLSLRRGMALRPFGG